MALGGCLWGGSEINPGHVYVENTSDGERELATLIAEQTDGTLDPEIQAWYRIPEDYALQFENVLEPNETHVVRTRLRGSSPENREAVTVELCSENRDEGQRVVTVRLQPDAVGIIPYGCEEAYTRQELEYVDASEYRIESLDGRLTGTPAE